jgi:hypothetical protein
MPTFTGCIFADTIAPLRVGLRDPRELPLLERKAMLEKLIASASSKWLRYSDLACCCHGDRIAGFDDGLSVPALKG